MKPLLPRLGLVGLLGLGVYLGILALRPSAHARFVAAQEQATADCRAYRRGPGHANADVCRYDDFGPSLMGAFGSANEKLDTARAAFDRADIPAAQQALVLGMAEGRELDRRGSAIGQIMGAKIIDRGLDLLDAHRAELGTSGALAVLGSGVVDRTTKPFDTDRIHNMWRLAEGLHLGGTPGADERALADEMKDDDVLFREMQRAVLASDVPRCEAAANKLGPHEARGAETMLCGKLHAVRLVHDRLEAQLVALMSKSLPPPPR